MSTICQRSKQRLPSIIFGKGIYFAVLDTMSSVEGANIALASQKVFVLFQAVFWKTL